MSGKSIYLHPIFFLHSGPGVVPRWSRKLRLWRTRCYRTVGDLQDALLQDGQSSTGRSETYRTFVALTTGRTKSYRTGKALQDAALQDALLQDGQSPTGRVATGRTKSYRTASPIGRSLHSLQDAALQDARKRATGDRKSLSPAGCDLLI